jgi:hypothetical protein
MIAAATKTSPAYRAAADIEALVRAFDDCSLPRAAWTHAAHLTVALWYLLRHDAEEATALIRAGIQRYNAAHGIITTPTGGYHETLTRFWIRCVRKYLSAHTYDTPLVALANGLCARYDKNTPLKYYSRERLFSAEARAGWIEPDLFHRKQ